MMHSVTDVEQHHLEAAKTLTNRAHDAERSGDWSAAECAHAEAARLFRLAAVASSKGQELRMLARHHDARARECRANIVDIVPQTTAGGGNYVIVDAAVTGGGLDSRGGADGSVLVSRVATTPPSAQTPAAPVVEGWLQALEGLIDRFFSRGDESTTTKTVAGRMDNTVSSSPSPDSSAGFKRSDDNAMLQSFVVVPDYSGSASAGNRVALLAYEDEIARLKQRVEQLSRQNESLVARVTELEAERRMIKESVFQLHGDLLEQSVRMTAPGSSMFIAPALETLLNQQARTPSPTTTHMSQEQQARTPSPAPDLVDYIRGLERRVEEQALEISQLRRSTKKKH